MTALPTYGAAAAGGASEDRARAAAFGAMRAAGVGSPAASQAIGVASPLAQNAAHGVRRGLRRPEYDLVVRFSYVGSPGNAPVGIDGFMPPSPATVPAQPGGQSYQDLGGVPYVYAIGQTEVTAGQYVTFLNKVDPGGGNPVQPVTGIRLWVEAFSPVSNPLSGEINYVKDAAPGSHYRLAAEFWRDKPLVNANLFHFAYFANSMYNGATVAIDEVRDRSPLGFAVRTQTRYIELSSQISTGMYNLQDSSYPFFERQDVSGYVVPSEDEWVKAAYYSPRPTGNGTHYYYYPTVGDSAPTPLQTGGEAPTVDGLGNVIRSNLKRGVAYANYDSMVVWKPPYAPESSQAGASMVSVGQDRTPSPWLTYDQAGNVVEYTDTITAAPTNLPDPHDVPVYVRAHGGVAGASDWQLWLTATGTTSPYGQQLGLTATQGGARFGYVPDAKADRSIPTSKRASASALARPMASDDLVYRLDDRNTGESISTPDLALAVRLASEGSGYRFVGASVDRPAS